MTILTRGGSVVKSVFGIHGDDENDITGGFAYLLSQSDTLLKHVVDDLHPRITIDLSQTIVGFQTNHKEGGITDIELNISDLAYIVFEAKKGMTIPTTTQLNKYASLCKESRCTHKQLVVLSAIRHELSETILGFNEIDGIPVTTRSWEWVRSLIKRAISEEKRVNVRRLLSEYCNYLEGFMGHDRVFSNMVYIVALAKGNPNGWDVSWIDVVEKHNSYFYPLDKNWPPPPNYIGFRYNGRLQSICHVESFKVVTNLPAHFGQSKKTCSFWNGSYYLLKLGPRIELSHTVRSGPRVHRAARVWCMLDTLLTSDTVSDALTETERRKGETV